MEAQKKRDCDSSEVQCIYLWNWIAFRTEQKSKESARATNIKNWSFRSFRLSFFFFSLKIWFNFLPKRNHSHNLLVFARRTPYIWRNDFKSKEKNPWYNSMYTLQETKCLCKFQLSESFRIMCIDDGITFNRINLKFLKFVWLCCVKSDCYGDVRVRLPSKSCEKEKHSHITITVRRNTIPLTIPRIEFKSFQWKTCIDTENNFFLLFTKNRKL